MPIVTVKPAEGRHVRNHQRGFAVLAPDGEPVELDSEWRKRIADGDVIVVPGDGQASDPAPASKKPRS